MSGIRICINTNVFLNVINREEPFYSDSRTILSVIDERKIVGVVPTLVIAEILTGYFANNKDTEAEEFVSALSTNENLKISPLGMEIALISSRIKAKTGLRLPDAVVLGTAVQERADFLVTNDGHFPREFEHLKVLNPSAMAANLSD